MIKKLTVSFDIHNTGLTSAVAGAVMMTYVSRQHHVTSRPGGGELSPHHMPTLKCIPLRARRLFLTLTPVLPTSLHREKENNNFIIDLPQKVTLQLTYTYSVSHSLSSAYYVLMLLTYSSTCTAMQLQCICLMYMLFVNSLADLNPLLTSPMLKCVVGTEL